MRDIKFRAWNIKYKEMRRVMAMNWLGQGIFRVNATDNPDNYVPLLYMPNYNGAELKEFELMQYVGLKDMNGKDIYVGDILKYSEGNNDSLCHVVFNNGSFCVEWFVEEYFRTDLDYWNSKTCIIGNIYENPEIPRTPL